MKRVLSTVVAFVFLACMALGLASCGDASTRKDISQATSIADLEGAIIASQSGTFHETARKQIKNVQGSVYSDFSSMLIALRSGAIDGYIAEEPTALTVCAKDSTLDYLHLKNNENGFSATEEDTAIAIGCKKGSSLIPEINRVLATISEETRKELMEQIARVSAGETVDAFVLSNATPKNPSGKLRVAMECAYEPFNWTQKTDANGAVKISSAGSAGLYANGYDVQIAKYVANALNLELEIYAESWSSLVAGVMSGTYDAIIAGMSPTADRKESIDFTDVYYRSNLVIIYRKSF